MILTGHNPDRLERAAAGLGALSSVTSGAAGPAAHGRFFSLPEQAGHVMVTAAGPAVR